jgi:RNA ligase (TIGR02306 family)
MTQAIVEIVEVSNLSAIPDSDFLNVAQIGGYQIVVKKSDFKVGDLGLFISVDSVVPEEFLKFYNLHDKISKGRIRTIRLRGVYSQGLLLPLTHPEIQNAQVGDEFGEKLGIKKYEPPVQFKGLDTRPWPDGRLMIYDIESLQNPKHRNLFAIGEEVIMREKIHGKHMIVALIDNKFHVCTRRTSLKEPETITQNEYWYMAYKLELENKLRQISEDHEGKDVVIRGELFGPRCQFLHYGRKEVDFAAFDIEIGLGTYINDSEFQAVCDTYEIQTAPVLFKGPFSIEKVEELAEQKSTISLANDDLQEGIVITPKIETSIPRFGRKILKYISKEYALASGKEVEYAD